MNRNERIEKLADELNLVKTVLWEVASELDSDGKKCASKVISQQEERVIQVEHELRGMLEIGESK